MVCSLLVLSSVFFSVPSFFNHSEVAAGGSDVSGTDSSEAEDEACGALNSSSESWRVLVTVKTRRKCCRSN